MEEINKLKEEIKEKNIKIWELKEDCKEIKTKLERLQATTPETISNIHNSKYDQRNLYFTANGKQYKMNQKDALEITYTLVDSLGLSYSILEEVESIVNKNQE